MGTNNLMDIENMKYSAPIGKSHHVLLEFDYLIDTDDTVETEDEQYKYCFHRCDYASIKRELAEFDWDTLFENKTVLEMYSIFVDICLNLIEMYVPKIKCQSNSQKPKWMTREVLAQIDKKAKAWKRLKARKTTLRAEKYRQERNKTNLMVKLAKMAFENYVMT